MARLQHVWLYFLVFSLSFGWSIPATRAADKPDPTGTWKWKTTFGDRTIESTLKLNVKDGKLSGTLSRPDRETKTKIEEGKLDGNKLSFQITRERNDRKFTIKFKGKLSEDSIKGEVELAFGDRTRNFPWEAKRAIAIADVLGTWHFKVTTPDRTIETSLKLARDGDKLKGTYSSRRGEIQAEQISLKGSALSFRVTRESDDGRKFVVTYKGKPRGNAIKGAVDYDFDGQTGSVDFEGKLVREAKKKGKEKSAGKKGKKETL